MKYVDLFCGMGSFTYSFDKLGFECVMACDICPHARQNFEHNFGIRPKERIEDIDEHGVPDHDILCAGFPCQSFSQAGRHNGFLDPRGTMFFHVLRLVRAKTPRFVVLENVPALLNHDQGRTFKTIRACLEQEGYEIECSIENSADYGLPQSRRRLIVVAYHASALANIARPVLSFGDYRRQVSLSQFFGRPFERTFAFTIRCGGRRSGINDRHNWDSYRVGGEVITLTVDDAKRLQGFDEYELKGADSHQWKLLGNTIPTVFTRMIGERLLSCCTAAASS